ncbi:stage III sporulation protein AG [Brevibacillus fluminis]|uniref:stage III sporulation protein AG n=1 Tax=Brevibacillus fluminis TaxID=511487 RepID=UPI003F8BF6AB
MFAKWKPSMRYLFILLGVGAVLMILTDFLGSDKDKPLGLGSMQQQETLPAAGQDHAGSVAAGSSASNDWIKEYENNYETQLAEILETVIGVGQVQVMVNLDSTPEIVIEKNRDSRTTSTQETDKERATRNQSEQTLQEQALVVKDSKQEQPVVLKTLKPKVRGVLVVAKGAENVQIKAWILEAVQKVLDVPAYKISILPKKG